MSGPTSGPTADERWLAVRVRPRGGDDARAAAVAALFAAGSQGVQEDGEVVLTQFPPSCDVEALRLALLAADPTADVAIARAEPVDWTEGWKALLSAHELGGLAVVPPWLADGRDPERTVVIDPGMAFGTGDHPTTRGVIRLMQALVRPGDFVVDLGAGSAVLSIAAAKLGATRVAAVEFDPEAIGNAEENVRRNAAEHVVTVIQGDAHVLLPLLAPARVILANIISSVLVGLMPSIRDALPDDGVAILSGILTDERERMMEAARATRFRVGAEDAEGAWWSAVLARDVSDDAGAGSRIDGATIATFFSLDRLAGGAAAVGTLVTLGEDASHHMRVRRLAAGDVIALRDGLGNGCHARLTKLAKNHALVELGEVTSTARPPAVHLLLPVADRDRMLWLAEKCAELGIESWRPVLWRRSRSVAPRGEGAGFQAKIRARMASALVQSEGAWLPELLPDAPLDRALRALPDGARLLLDPDGAPFDESDVGVATVLAVGPEGGLEHDEVDSLLGAGFRRVRLPGNILRFETAAIVAVAFARASLDRAARHHTAPVPTDVTQPRSD